MPTFNKEVAECVGLWLAEGDNKTTGELTFTNNCFDLILFFKEIISSIYFGNNKPRLYIYSPSDRQLFTQLDGFKKINFYIDKRANRPYYIYRLADSKFLREWRVMVNHIINNEYHYSNILRGIFAGEGNIKHDVKSKSRNLRISSKNRNELIERLLNFYKLRFSFDHKKRMYWIRARDIDIAKSIDITGLHPEKNAQFNKMMSYFSEKHYSPLELKNLISSELTNFRRTKELSSQFSRSELRISEVLQELKREGKVDWIKKEGRTYWMHKYKKEGILTREKIDILSELERLKSFTAIGKKLNIFRKSISKKFIYYEHEGLIVKDGSWWKLTDKGQKLVCGIDESGREIKEILVPRKVLSSVP